VAGVRASTGDAHPPSFTAAPLASGQRSACFPSVVNVVAAVRALPDKQFMSDPLPTKLLTDNVDLLEPFLVKLFNQSLAVVTVPSIFKSAYIKLPLKKHDSMTYK